MNALFLFSFAIYIRRSSRTLRSANPISSVLTNSSKINYNLNKNIVSGQSEQALYICYFPEILEKSSNCLGARKKLLAYRFQIQRTHGFDKHDFSCEHPSSFVALYSFWFGANHASFAAPYCPRTGTFIREIQFFTDANY